MIECLRMVNMSISAFELVVDAKAGIGESPLWCADQGALYWLDVKAPALYCTDVTTLETTSWCLPSDIGGYALKPNAAGGLAGTANRHIHPGFCDWRTLKNLRRTV
jgi:sugar lactone lactonase YvrE